MHQPPLRPQASTNLRHNHITIAQKLHVKLDVLHGFTADIDLRHVSGDMVAHFGDRGDFDRRWRLRSLSRERLLSRLRSERSPE